MSFFFFNDTATTEIYTLSLHDALPIWARAAKPYRDRIMDFLEDRFLPGLSSHLVTERMIDPRHFRDTDRKSTRLNSSHANISYAVFCLKKKKHHTNLARY